MGCSLPGFSVRGILQPKILEWVVIPFSRGSSQPRDQTQVFCITGRFFTIWATRVNNYMPIKTLKKGLTNKILYLTRILFCLSMHQRIQSSFFFLRYLLYLCLIIWDIYIHEHMQMYIHTYYPPTHTYTHTYRAVLSHPVVSNSLWPHGLQPARLLCPWDSPGKNTRVGCHALPWGIFPILGSNPGLLHCRWILYWLSRQRRPPPPPRTLTYVCVSSYPSDIFKLLPRNIYNLRG